MRHLTTVLLIAVALTATASPASADPAVTEHFVANDLVVTFTSPFPCGGEPYDMTWTETFVLNTVTKDGALYQSGTGAGTLSATPSDGTGPTYTGHFDFRFGPEFTSSSVVSTSVLHISATADDGSRVDQVTVGHLTFVLDSARGVSFFKLIC